jgi:hypothetical protein
MLQLFLSHNKSFCKNPQLKDGGNGNPDSSNALEVLISHKKSFFLPKKPQIVQDNGDGIMVPQNAPAGLN